MVQKYYKAASPHHLLFQESRIIKFTSLATGIATAVLLFLAGQPSGSRNCSMSPLASLQAPESADVRELGQTLLIILMFDKAEDSAARFACTPSV